MDQSRRLPRFRRTALGGTHRATCFRGPNLWQADLGTAKRFPVFHDRVTGQFRAEIFNIFNRSQYANASGNFTLVGNAQYALTSYLASPGPIDPVRAAKLQAAIDASKPSFSLTNSQVNTGATGSGTPRRIQFGLRFDF